MSQVIAFTVSQKSKNIYQLPIATTLQHFVAYDFTYFMQQCAALTEQCVQTGVFDPVAFSAPKEYIRKCHPYFQILVQEDFEQITLDFAIDHICRTQQIGLEELWATHISATKSFWQAIFQRISAYKSGSAINQWDNLLRMQRYAAAKLAFIFDGTPVRAEEYRTRKEYYDLAFSIMAGKLGYEENDLPIIKYYTPALLPGAQTILGRLSGELDAVVHPKHTAKGKRVARRNVNALLDQSAGVVINNLIDLPRPGPMEARAAVEACAAMPEKVYVPTSFKAILDLEFNEIIDRGIAFVRSPETGMLVIAQEEDLNLSLVDEELELFAEAPQPASPPAPEPAPQAPPIIEPPVSVPEMLAVQPESEPADEVPEPLTEPVMEMPRAPEILPEIVPAIEPPPVLEVVPESTMWTPAPQQEFRSVQPDIIPTPQPIEPVYVPPAPELPRPTVKSKVQHHAVKPLFESSHVKLRQLAEKTNDMNFATSVQMQGEDLNVRCQLVQGELRNAIGRQEKAVEFDEWSRSLMQLRIQIVRKQLSMDYLERFLSATEQLYSLHIA